jgi:signal transduction histidine kinase
VIASIRQWPRAVQLAAAGLICLAASLVWALTGGYFWPRWVWFAIAAALALRFTVERVLRVPAGRRRWLALDAAVLAFLTPFDVAIWALSGGGFFWPLWSLTALGIIFGTQAWLISRYDETKDRALTERVDTLTRTRRGALEGQASELKRIERDLHDGAQARMVSLALNLGMAEDLIRSDPDAAVKLLEEARASAGTALDELRAVMHSIHPAVLADRGLGGGVRALALDLALPVAVEGEPPSGLPAAVESAVYFATAECLANAVKHSSATSGRVIFTHDATSLTVTILDNGSGGASVAGAGLRGVARRLEAFDGRLVVDSPIGGPTRMAIMMPRVG